jgi:hypothetical protein
LREAGIIAGLYFFADHAVHADFAPLRAVVKAVALNLVRNFELASNATNSFTD